MSSSQPFASSPFSPTSINRRRSNFTWKNLSTLAHSATNCPLRVIAHIDLDAFYAQCETVRLGIDPSKPLAVQQWQGLIAINYPARAFGLSRHVAISEAKEKCPEIICQHVATWKEGDTTWSYSEDAFKEIATRKVSLDPYRIQSRKILALIKNFLPLDKQKVEKASIDEVFLDLSAQVHGVLLERFPELRGPPPYDDPTERLPRPPTTALDWAADALVDLDNTQWEEDDPDWDDVCTLIASEIVRDVRKAVFDELHFTCSAGIARNKMIAKLGSAYKKPNAQTVVRNRAVQHFLSGFKFTKIRNLGGKLGDEVVAAFNTDLVSELLPVPLEQLQKQLGDDVGSWLHGILRGEDTSEVNPRTQIKSMLSAKSFRPSINTFEVACKWLRIFVADIYSRLVEEGVLENKRRPKTINLHHRQGQSTKSKQSPIPLGKTITEPVLFNLAKNLMAQVVVDGRAWPCANLSLSVAGFEDGVTGNQGIGGFLVHGEEAKAMKCKSNDLSRRDDVPAANKRRRVGDRGIERFFGAKTGTETKDVVIHAESEHEVIDAGAGNGSARLFAGNENGEVERPADEEVDEDEEVGEGDEIDEETEHDKHLDEIYNRSDDDANESENQNQDQNESTPRQRPRPRKSTKPPPSTSTSPSPSTSPSQTLDETNPTTNLCTRCNKQIPIVDEIEHADFHFALDLQDEQSSPFRPKPKLIPSTSTLIAPTSGLVSSTSKPITPAKTTQSAKRSRGRPPLNSGGGVRAKGQKKLAFG
ncbi:n-acetyltransferase eso1 [Acrodontium crateriforme]|uniref:DNA polymerase eta n=1 Tax=Acrodontium crateriforme TaxID=150365 RepID=A0AAQ3RB44_9PEZI|nr:n-acetyltransferase eso1 [Acrodontium crateriforme]